MPNEHPPLQLSSHAPACSQPQPSPPAEYASLHVWLQAKKFAPAAASAQPEAQAQEAGVPAP